MDSNLSLQGISDGAGQCLSWVVEGQCSLRGCQWLHPVSSSSPDENENSKRSFEGPVETDKTFKIPATSVTPSSVYESNQFYQPNKDLTVPEEKHSRPKFFRTSVIRKNTPSEFSPSLLDGRLPSPRLEDSNHSLSCTEDVLSVPLPAQMQSQMGSSSSLATNTALTYFQSPSLSPFSPV